MKINRTNGSYPCSAVIVIKDGSMFTINSSNIAGIVGFIVDITTNANPLVEKAHASCDGTSSKACNPNESCTPGGHARGLC